MAGQFNFDRTEASDPISIDALIEQSLQDRGGSDVVQPRQNAAKQASAPQVNARPQGTRVVSQLPPSRPSAEVDGGEAIPQSDDPHVGSRQYASANGSTDGGGKGAGRSQSEVAQVPTPPPRPSSQGGTPEEQGPHDYTIPKAVAGAGLGLLGLLLARRMQGKGGEVPTQVMPPEAAGGDPIDSFLKMANRQVPPERQLTGPVEAEAPRATGETITPEAPAPQKQIAYQPEAEPELVKPEEFNDTPAEEAPKAKRSRGSKKAVADAKVDAPTGETTVLPHSGIEAPKADINAALGKLLASADDLSNLARAVGTGRKLRVPKIAR